MTCQVVSPTGQIPERLETAPPTPSRIRVSAVQTAHFECVTPATWTEHAHETHELLWGARGVLTVDAGGGSYAVPATLGLWIPAGVPHAVRSSQGTGFYCSHIGATVPRPLDRQTTAVIVPPAVSELLRHMHKLDMEPASRSLAEQLAVELLEVLDTQPMPMPMPADPRLQVLARAMLDDPGQDRSLEEWSAELAISVRNLSRLFRRETGMTFAQWRIHARVRAALGLLAAGLPVSTVSRRVGYQNPSAFVQVFSRVMGHTPGWYVASLKAGSDNSLSGSG